MQNINTILTLDVYDYDLTPSTMKAIALDSNTRSVTAYITQHGQPYDVGQSDVTLTVIRPDGIGAQVTGEAYEYETSVEDTTVTRHGAYAELSPASLAKKGKLIAQFMFTSGEQVLRTEIFTISCGEALDASTDTWAGEYQGYNLDELVQSVNESSAKVDAMEQDVSDLKSGLSAVLKDRGTLTSDDDLNTVTTPGVYWYAGTNKPANAVSRNLSSRVLVIKSTTATNYGSEWQITISDGQMYYRSHHPSGTPDTWSDWVEVADNADIQSVLAQIDSYDETTVRYRATLTSADDLNAVEKTGSYFFSTDNKPANSPTNLLSRPVVIKSATASNHNGEAQFVIQDGVFYFRSKEGSADDWNDWKSYGLGAPVYQQETLPYNAVTYHAKWDELIQDRVLRRVNLGYVDNVSAYPIYAYEFCPQRDMVVASGGGSTPRAFDWSNALYQRPKILIIGGVHGNEKCTPMDIYAIAKMLMKRDNNDVACKFDWYFIPLVNPWGYSHARLDSSGNILYDNTGTTAQIVECTESINAGIRNNAHGQNINRDWSDVVYTADGVQYGFQTPELQLIKDYVLSIAPDFFIDAHQNHSNASTSETNPVCCHAGAPINSSDSSAEYVELMRKIYRYIDIANADTDKTMLRYANHPIHKYQACRIWNTLPASTSEHYFAGVTALNGSTVIGNTQHGNIATPYSICTETSEICATYAKTTTWYNPVACTFSCTYLWNIIKQIASLF